MRQLSTSLRPLLLASLCLSLLVPIDLHGAVAEIEAHDFEGVVWVDARHASQDAHYEHSAKEIRSRCVACVLTQKSDELQLRPGIQPLKMPAAGRLSPANAVHPPVARVRCSPSRAPPLS